MNAILPQPYIASCDILNDITVPVIGQLWTPRKEQKSASIAKCETDISQFPDIDATGLDAMVRDLNAQPFGVTHKGDDGHKLFVVRPDGSETEVRDQVVPFSGADRLVVREGGGRIESSPIEDVHGVVAAHDAEQWGAPGVKLGDPEEKPATITRPDGTTREVQPMDSMNYGDAVTAGDRPIQVVDPITGMELIVPPGETYRAQRDTSKTWPPGCAFRDYDEDESAWWPLAVAVICTVIVTGYMIWRLAH